MTRISFLNSSGRPDDIATPITNQHRSLAITQRTEHLQHHFRSEGDEEKTVAQLQNFTPELGLIVRLEHHRKAIQEDAHSDENREPGIFCAPDKCGRTVRGNGTRCRSSLPTR